MTLEQYLETEPAYSRIVVPALQVALGGQPVGVNFDASPAREINRMAADIRAEYDNAPDAEIISDLQENS